MGSNLYLKFHSVVMSIYRMITGNAYDKVNPMKNMLSDEVVIDSHNLMCPLTIIRCARLSLSVRTATKRPKAIITESKLIPASIVDGVVTSCGTSDG